MSSTVYYISGLYSTHHITLSCYVFSYVSINIVQSYLLITGFLQTRLTHSCINMFMVLCITALCCDGAGVVEVTLTDSGPPCVRLLRHTAPATWPVVWPAAEWSAWTAACLCTLANQYIGNAGPAGSHLEAGSKTGDILRTYSISRNHLCQLMFHKVEVLNL